MATCPSLDRLSTNPNSTIRSANNCRVQWSWPLGASLQAKAIRWASPLSSNLRKRLACTWSCNTPSKPASAYRRLIRYTVPSATSRAATTRGAFQPSSILSRIRARATMRAACLPPRISRFKHSRSSSVNRIVYRFPAMLVLFSSFRAQNRRLFREHEGIDYQTPAEMAHVNAPFGEWEDVVKMKPTSARERTKTRDAVAQLSDAPLRDERTARGNVILVPDPTARRRPKGESDSDDPELPSQWPRQQSNGGKPVMPDLDDKAMLTYETVTRLP